MQQFFTDATLCCCHSGMTKLSPGRNLRKTPHGDFGEIVGVRNTAHEMEGSS
jgi:hypothetical protein